jgi:hypothetical protein
MEVGDSMINENKATGGIKIGNGRRSARRNHAPGTQIPHDLTWDPTRVATMGSQRPDA